MKLVIVPNKKENIKKYKKIGASAFIFGLKGFSSGYSLTLTKEEIKNVIDENSDVDFFVAINKNIFNDELNELENNLLFLDKLKIKGILFYDLAVLNIKLRKRLSVDLVWNQTHMVTNYKTCNYYYEKGVKYGIVSNEITLEEINDIKKNTNMILFTMIIGYPIMSFSRRSLLSNYFISNNKKKESQMYWLTNNNEKYFIREEESGDAIYYGKILNGSAILNDLNVDYAILNELEIEESIFEKVIALCIKIINNKDVNAINEIKNLIGNYQGFFFQKTIYKVKKND